MIICVCNRLRDTQLRDACQQCPSTQCAEAILQHLGCKSQCGSCIGYIEDVMIPQSQQTGTLSLSAESTTYGIHATN